MWPASMLRNLEQVTPRAGRVFSASNWVPYFPASRCRIHGFNVERAAQRGYHIRGLFDLYCT
jgi:hypothetical protein